MTSSDDTRESDSRSRSGLLALAVCGILVAGFMPLVVTRVDVPERSKPQVQQIESPLVVDLLPPAPGPDVVVDEPATPNLPTPLPHPAGMDDAAGQNSRLSEKQRGIEARERARKPGVNPLREPGSQPKQKNGRPRAAQLLLDEFP